MNKLYKHSAALAGLSLEYTITFHTGVVEPKYCCDFNIDDCKSANPQELLFTKDPPRQIPRLTKKGVQFFLLFSEKDILVFLTWQG